MAKSNGERGHPCRVPRKSRKGSECWVLVHTDARGDEYSSLSHVTSFSPKPNCFRVRNKKGPFHPVEGFLRIQVHNNFWFCE